MDLEVRRFRQPTLDRPMLWRALGENMNGLGVNCETHRPSHSIYGQDPTSVPCWT
jgi:hypothetical protein